MPLQSPKALINNPDFSDVSEETRTGIFKTIEFELDESSLPQEKLSRGLRYLINQDDRKTETISKKAKVFHLLIACFGCGCRSNRTKKELPTPEELQKLAETQRLLQGEWKSCNKDNSERVNAFTKAVLSAYLETEPEEVISTQPNAPLIQNQTPICIYSDENNPHPFFSSQEKQPSPTPTDDSKKTNAITARL